MINKILIKAKKKKLKKKKKRSEVYATTEMSLGDMLNERRTYLRTP